MSEIAAKHHDMGETQAQKTKEARNQGYPVGNFARTSIDSKKRLKNNIVLIHWYSSQVCCCRADRLTQATRGKLRSRSNKHDMQEVDCGPKWHFAIARQIDMLVKWV